MGMVFFHFFYDLNTFNFLHIDFSSWFWYWFPRFIAFLFLFCVGASLQKAYSKKIYWKKFWIRFFKIALGAIAISLITYYLFPKHWVFFGTLHCIALSSVLGLLFLNRPYTSLLSSFGILLFLFFSGWDVRWMSEFIGRKSMDFIPIYPWFFAVLWGLFYEQKNGSRWVGLLLKKTPSFLLLLGRKALPIYLLHQPVLYSFFWLIRQV